MKINPKLEIGSTGHNVEDLVGKVLYEGSTQRNITLNDSAANYDYIIFFYQVYNLVYGSIRVDNPNGKIVAIPIVHAGSSGNAEINTKCLKIEGTSVSIYEDTRYSRITFNIDNTISVKNENHIIVTKIIGYNN